MKLPNQILGDLRTQFYQNIEMDSLFDAIEEAKTVPIFGSYFSNERERNVDTISISMITHQIKNLRIEGTFIKGDVEFLRFPHDPLRNRFQYWLYLWAKGLKILPVIRAIGTVSHIKKIYAWDYIPVDNHPRHQSWVNDAKEFFLF